MKNIILKSITALAAAVFFISSLCCPSSSAVVYAAWGISFTWLVLFFYVNSDYYISDPDAGAVFSEDILDYELLMDEVTLVQSS